MFDEGRPIFQQIAEQIAGDILRGRYPEGTQVPSTNELAAFLRINPATAGKGLGLLVDEGILEKRRGIGMFVVPGAKARIAAERGDRFVSDFVAPLVREARSIGLDRDTVIRLLDAGLRGAPEESDLPEPPGVPASAPRE